MVFRVRIDDGKRKRYAYCIGLDEWPEEQIYCLECGRKWKKSLMQEYGTDIPVVLSNDNYPDFMWYYIDHISEKAKSVLENESVTGIRLEKAHIFSVNDLTNLQKKELRSDGFNMKKMPEDPPPYYKLHVDIGAEYHSETNLIPNGNCIYCGYKAYRIKGEEEHVTGPVILKAASIVGNDLFKAEGYGDTLFCTERFFEIYTKHGLTGLLFEEIKVLD